MLTSVLRVVAGFALVAGCLASASASTSLIYSGRTILDPVTNLEWQRFDSIEEGALQNFRIASARQVSELFLRYAPHENGGALPGFEPTYGGVYQYTTREDGSMFSVSIASTYYGDIYVPPTLMALGGSFSFGDGMIVPATTVLLVKVDSPSGHVDVLLRNAFTYDQYGSVWAKEEGYIAPDLSATEQFPWWPENQFWEWYCPEWGCNWDGLNPYFTETGGFRSTGFLMVSGVPEPSTYLLMLAGLIVVSSFAHRTLPKR